MSKKLDFMCNKCKKEFSVEDGVDINEIKCPTCGETDDLLIGFES